MNMMRLLYQMMNMHVNDVKNRIIRDLAENSHIFGVAQTGDINAELIAGCSDIDMFVLCSEIPATEERKNVYEKYAADYTGCQMNVCSGGLWGSGDILIIDGIDVMYMYFTMAEMADYLDEVLAGKHLDRVRGFYPTGRLASVETISILFERDGVWTNLKEKAAGKPDDLFRKLYQYHMARILNEEDLGRVSLRKEVMFYHTVLENAVDHFLQALYAANRTYFPSRKRIEAYIESFEKKPDDCYKRLVQIHEKSVSPDTMDESIAELNKMADELSRIN